MALWRDTWRRRRWTVSIAFYTSNHVTGYVSRSHACHFFAHTVETVPFVPTILSPNSIIKISSEKKNKTKKKNTPHACAAMMMCRKIKGKNFFENGLWTTSVELLTQETLLTFSWFFSKRNWNSNFDLLVCVRRQFIVEVAFYIYMRTYVYEWLVSFAARCSWVEWTE